MSIESINTEDRIFNPSEKIIKNANISGMDNYKELVNNFKNDYQGTWSKLAKELLIWDKPFTKILNDENPPLYKWFEDGKLNASYNCLDRHVNSGKGTDIALVWEGNNPEEDRT